MDRTREAVDDPIPPELDNEYLTGFKLWSVHAAITLVVFLMMLDTTIIGTVSNLTTYYLYPQEKSRR